MTYKIPDKLFGIKVEGAYERFLEKAEKEKADDKIIEPKAQVIRTRANINPSDYIQIPGTSSLISKSESYKGKKWDETHYVLAENGLYMPTPSLFMMHFLNVRNAIQKNTSLYDGNSNQIPMNEAEDLWKYLASGHMGGCWTWLDSKFIEGAGALGLDIITNHKVVINGLSKSLAGKIRMPLETCIQEYCFIDLDSINSQGLPAIKSPSQEYKQGQSIYFWHPIKDRVAWFVANSDGADLDCDGDPSDSDSSLGVFLCAEGTKIF